MQTFFVSYNTGEYDSYHEYVYSIDAESKEVLLAEIDRACDEYIAAYSGWLNECNLVRQEYKQYRKERGGSNGLDVKSYHNKIKKAYDKFPYPSSMIIFGNKIAPFDELNVSGKDKAIVDSGLDIMTIDEYIVSCRPIMENE